MLAPGTLFEELGFNYIGPMDGHNLNEMLRTLKNLKSLKGPKLLHLITTKGKGFSPAEKNPIGFHALNKIEANTKKTKFLVPFLKSLNLNRLSEKSMDFPFANDCINY